MVTRLSRIFSATNFQGLIVERNRDRSHLSRGGLFHKFSKVGIALSIILTTLLLAACTDDPMGPDDQEPVQVPFTHMLNYELENRERISAGIGIWMFKEQGLDIENVADWDLGYFNSLGVRLYDPELWEPINIIWIDLVSENEALAEIELEKFLLLSDFSSRSGSFEDYLGYYPPDIWRSQYKRTWSDGGANEPNNHGRVFPSNMVMSSTGHTAIISTGAFSREDGAAVPIIQTPILIHQYISFDQARDRIRVNGRTGWIEPVDIINIGNAPGLHPQGLFQTGDHSGARLFIRTDDVCGALNLPKSLAGATRTYRLLSNDFITRLVYEDVPFKVNGYDVVRIRATHDPPGLGEYIGCDESKNDIVEVGTDWWSIQNPADNGRYFWNPPLHTCYYGDPVDMVCEWSGRFAGEPARSETRVLGYEDVEVPAGIFKEAMKVRQLDYEDGYLLTDAIVWLHPKVGFVRAVDMVSGEELVLEEYSNPDVRGTFARPRHVALQVRSLLKHVLNKREFSD